MQQLPQNNQCHKCHEWFGTVHVCAIDVKAALAKCCNQCDDGVRVLAAELATLREKAAMVDELRKDAERYRKLRGWMSSNVKEGWGRVTDLSAVFCYVSWQEGDSYLDNLPECNVGLMQKDAAIAQGQTK